jgi:hypothetical protein
VFKRENEREMQVERETISFRDIILTTRVAIRKKGVDSLSCCSCDCLSEVRASPYDLLKMSCLFLGLGERSQQQVFLSSFKYKERIRFKKGIWRCQKSRFVQSCLFYDLSLSSLSLLQFIFSLKGKFTPSDSVPTLLFRFCSSSFLLRCSSLIFIHGE